MPLLTIDRVAKRYGGLPAVDDVTFEVDEGEILALVGPNGAGKSTLLKMIGGLITPDAGAITLGETRIGRLPPHRVRQLGVALAMQTPQVFESMTTAENVMIGSMFGTSDSVITEKEAHRRAGEALSFVGLEGRARDPVGTLNLHQRRFLELARALAGRPRLLLLDEVMAGLNDNELEASIGIARRARDQLGVTIIWVEHVMKAVMDLAERMLVLNFGKVLSSGIPTEVMKDPAVIEAYLGEAASVA